MIYKVCTFTSFPQAILQTLLITETENRLFGCGFQHVGDILPVGLPRAEINIQNLSTPYLFYVPTVTFLVATHSFISPTI